MQTQNSEFNILTARIADFARKSETGELSVSCFLSPAEVAVARIALTEKKLTRRAVFFGGYSEAERQRLFVLPSYTDDFDGDAQAKLETYFLDERTEGVCSLIVHGSGYRELSHRDYLGSILSLGLERDALGDIVLLDNVSAVIFCSAKIGEFLVESLEKISNDTVSVAYFKVTDEFSASREFKRTNHTVASNRLDCVVSAITGLSREKSQELIKKELCQLNYMTECRCDYSLEAPCVLTLRGYGKYILREFDGFTKKGRLKMSVDKYI